VELPIASPRSLSCDTMAAFQKKSVPGTITMGWIPNKLDSGFQWLDSGFHELDSGLQTRGFRIPQAKIAWILDSALPYIGRILARSRTVSDRSNL